MILIIYSYAAIILFLAISAYKAYQYANKPMHGRMELYPVPQEKGRHEYGGSYYEETEWWKKERQLSIATEIKEMLKEMLFIKKLFDHQKPLWWISYALHLGIYLMAFWTVLLVIGAGIGSATGSSLINFLIAISGTLGFMLTAIGAGALFFRRLSDSVLKKYTTPQEYFNVLLLCVAAVTGLAAWGFDFTFASAVNAMGQMLSFTPFTTTPIMVFHIIILGFMFIYIPASKMSHYVGKYFTFHKVLWENDPNLRGSAIEQKLAAASGYKPQTQWSAPHIQPPVNKGESM